MEVLDVDEEEDFITREAAMSDRVELVEAVSGMDGSTKQKLVITRLRLPSQHPEEQGTLPEHHSPCHHDLHSVRSIAQRKRRRVQSTGAFVPLGTVTCRNGKPFSTRQALPAPKCPTWGAGLRICWVAWKVR